MTRKTLWKENRMKKSGLLFMLAILACGAILVATGMFSSNSYFSKAESEEVKASSTDQSKAPSSSSSDVKDSSSQPSSTSDKPSTSSTEESATQPDASITEVAEVATPEETTVAAASQESVATKATYNTQVATGVPAQTQMTQQHVAPSGRVLSNGNTAGRDGAYAAAQMAAATGVDQATWEHIIARESNGQVGARNASGASGLFQTMPGWGSTATVQDQINSAINAYNAQGLSAWGY
ncbi:transglycosylase [Streptococcus halotolerans]|uniref:transglycosylase n=1 Tax=Streptococcus halotolerans TaxID=1814128 RepID=UPI000789909C|nr:transglycosylase [Streptococcus halotolerans]